MTNSLILPVFLLFSSIASPVFAQYSGGYDIIEICKQTPETTAWGEYLENNPDIYNQYYADLRDKSIFIPSNQALKKFASQKNYTIQERSNAFVDQSLFVGDMVDPSKYINTLGDRKTSTARQNRRADTASNGEGEAITLRTAAKGINLRNIFIGMIFGDSSEDSKRLKERSFEHAPDPAPPGITISTGLGKKSHVLFGSLKALQGILWVIDRWVYLLIRRDRVSQVLFTN